MGLVLEPPALRRPRGPGGDPGALAGQTSVDLLEGAAERGRPVAPLRARARVAGAHLAAEPGLERGELDVAELAGRQVDRDLSTRGRGVDVLAAGPAERVKLTRTASSGIGIPRGVTSCAIGPCCQQRRGCRAQALVRRSGGRGRSAQLPGQATILVSRYSSKPSTPFSRPIAALLVAAEGHVGAEPLAAVDAQRAGAHAAGDAQWPAPPSRS